MFKIIFLLIFSKLYIIFFYLFFHFLVKNKYIVTFWIIKYYVSAWIFFYFYFYLISILIFMFKSCVFFFINLFLFNIFFFYLKKKIMKRLLDSNALNLIILHLNLFEFFSIIISSQKLAYIYFVKLC